MSLANKKIVLGVTGSIAAYKSADLVRRLRDAGAEVRVVMTAHAKEFITPLTLQAVSSHPVRDDLFDLSAEAAMGHIELARWADVILVAPASASFMARLAQGRADDLLATICLATQAPIMVAPAMNQQMWEDMRTQDNRHWLGEQGVKLLGPAKGSQACGENGPGRMLEPQEIVQLMTSHFAKGVLKGLSVLITAGPTREAIDPVRYISNYSSGKMGYALAEAARNAGAHVCLVSGPVALAHPPGVEVVSVESAKEMHAAVMQRVEDFDILIGAAAVADYQPAACLSEKQAKHAEGMQLQLRATPDILASVAKSPDAPYVVGFAAETHDLLSRAKAKCERKAMDLIIANQVAKNRGMLTDDNEVYVLGADYKEHFPLESKQTLAIKLIELIGEQYDRKNDAA